MVKFGLLARLEAKAGKEKEVEEFLKSALSMAADEKGTITWYAVRINESTFGIFDTFNEEDGRTAHLSGPIAKALMQKAPELLTKDPVIEQIEILAAK